VKDAAPRAARARVSLIESLLGRLREIARGRDQEANGLRDQLEDLLEEHETRAVELTDQERMLLLNALSFGELEVSDVMVPRPDVKAAELGMSLGEVVQAMQGAGHTRLPVYRKTLDDVVGMIHIKDLLPFWGDGAEFRLEAILRPVLFVPPSMRVIDLLIQMRDTRTHMAIVVDEFGGTDGLATIGDLIEEIIGEIQDEHDKILPPQLVRASDGTYEADGRIEVEELEGVLGVELLDAERREDVDTLGGLIFTLLDRVPARGEMVRHPAGIEFEVLEADPRRIKRIRIHPYRPAADDRHDAAVG
jgi:magnesium and cobalt transporter